MLSKQQIMQEYRAFLARREDMTRAYTQQHPVIDVQCAVDVQPDDALPAPPSASRAPASLIW
jgi:hypothetical protein